MKKAKIGSFIYHVADMRPKFELLCEMGLDSFQLQSWSPSLRTDESAEKLVELSKEYNIEISNLWCGWTYSPMIASGNYNDMFNTWGLVPPDFRSERLKDLMQGADWAKKVGIKHVATHMGFIPENPNDPLYASFLTTVKILLTTIKANGQSLNFETGQETPMTMLRTFEDIGDEEHLGVNLDTANLILYGKGNPVDALKVFGKYVKGLHCKDGLFPTTGRKLGEEVPLGEGEANIAKVVEMLHGLKYKGHFTIEREISGEKQRIDIIKARDLLRELTSQYDWDFGDEDEAK